MENLPRHPRPYCWLWHDRGLATCVASHMHLTLATTHWGTPGIGPLDAYRAADGRVQHVHLSNLSGNQQHRLPQQGELDLGAFLHTLGSDGFEGPIVVELHPDTLGHEEGEAGSRLKRTADFCRQALGPG